MYKALKILILTVLLVSCDLHFGDQDKLVLKTLDATTVLDTSAIVQLSRKGAFGSFNTLGIVYSELNHEPTYPLSKFLLASTLEETTFTFHKLSRLTTYYYRAFASDGINCIYGAVKSFTTTLSLPQVVTSSISSINETSAISGGTISDDGGETLFSRGVCWSTLENPTVDLPTKSSDGRGNEAFRSSLRSLTPNTRYYVRAYASNSMGVSYGEQVSFIAQEHPLVAIRDSTEGGIVFYVDNTGRHGLVCALSDQSSGCYWSTTYPITTSAKSSALGSGFINTSLIVLSYGKGNYAAKICDDLVLNGYNDWYLPTYDEMTSIYFNLLMHDTGDFYLSGNEEPDPSPYWTSTEALASTAYILDMRKGRANSAIYTKNLNRARVRAIRSF